VPDEKALEASRPYRKGNADIAPPSQMQGLASGMGTFLGTCIRIPCEVLKQRLQTGKHHNMLQAGPDTSESLERNSA